jgi:hypothetical protein
MTREQPSGISRPLASSTMGGAVVSARVPDADAVRLQAVMDRSAVNVSERAAVYRQAGWKSFDPKSAPYTADQIRKERELYMRR